MAKFCKNCGGEVAEETTFCPNCGTSLQETPAAEASAPAEGAPAAPAAPANPEAKSKMVAGLLGIFLGAWGVHNFYLGNNSRGAIQIVVTLVTCGAGAIWGLVEGILILCGNISTDANGVPLKD